MVAHVGHQYVYLPEATEGVPHHAADVAGVGDVGGDGEDMLLRAGAGQINLSAPQVGFGAPADGDVGPFARESQGDGASQAACGAAHDGNPVFQTQVHILYSPHSSFPTLRESRGAFAIGKLTYA